jgi:hypothetical protein
MLGDPRIYLMKEPPYQVISDAVTENGKRVIVGGSDFSGVLAVKIEDGARYDFLAVKDVTAASEHDLFFNSKLQTMNLGADKYVLLLHSGGPFEFEMSQNALFGWVIGDAFTDMLDYSWVVLRLDEKIIFSRYLYLIPAALLAVMLAYRVFRQKRSLMDYRGAFLCGLSIASIRMVYGLLRAVFPPLLLSGFYHSGERSQSDGRRECILAAELQPVLDAVCRAAAGDWTGLDCTAHSQDGAR